MDLVPKGSKLRTYFEQPIWAGGVSRSTWALLFLSTPVYFFAADLFHTKALKEIWSLWRGGASWKRRLFRFGSMNLLMSLGITIAYFASIALLILSATSQPKEVMGYTSTYFDSVVFLAFFLLMGRCIDAYSKAQTASAVSMLGNLRPDTVNVIEPEQGQTVLSDYLHNESKAVSIDMVEVGDYVKVLPGERCSVDGIIVDGQSTFDESTLTGESRPVKHGVGEEIFAGTINTGTGAVVARIKAIEEGSLLNSIVSIVREGQLHRAPIERVAEKITGIFVPVVTLIAVLTWVIWLALGLSGSLPQRYLDIDVGGWTVWSLQFAISVFVVACPCGIGLAAPTALFVGSGLAAKYGILARGGGEAFQEGSNIDIICFDKTGTLTEGGEPKITDHHFTGTISLELLQIANTMEGASTHPLGIAVRNFVQITLEEAKNDTVALYSPAVKKIEEIPGMGLEAEIDGPEIAKVLLGNERLLEKYNSKVDDETNDLMNKWKAQGKSVILVATSKDRNNFEIRLVMGAADAVRPESKEVIEALTSRGIECWMISGDNEITAKAVAAQVSIRPENVIAGVLPAEKSDKVTWLQKSGNSKRTPGGARAIVAMVGDGVNDAPSLSIADVGIAIGSGSDLALTSAKFVLLKSDLYSLLNLLDISRVVFRRVKFNFAWALIYNLIGIPVAAGVIYPYHNSRLSPAWASLAMALSSVSVVTSSLLLKLYRPKGQ
ncbi:Cu(2+)-transporting P-type ATPase CCC2 [Sugiyamaella lignohabitans]|uniref:Cu(2+)-transporting P-type ATPase CCC2 n=1 Tax=Sugiyamaella lignohabitans TaxID=796027 RepID=A0A161HIL6_9ASCO|nr:Cu(2+)-transporting P-type ATPase CCC2 [Sugiyamaella lignohabitans]ANB11018.1 Cu(2+)-transporting P-type ATPase CCC2 [Sugiyamaella lignohabitans]